MFVATEEKINSKYDLDIRTLNEVVRIHPEKKVVEVRDLRTDKIYEESYDALLLATGSSPIVPNLPGVSGERVFTLWNIPDTDRVYNFIEKEKPRRAVVVGGGFIGLEMAENMHLRGIEVTVVEKADQVMAPLDPDMAKFIENELVDQGVRLYVGEGLAAVSADGRTVTLDSGRTIETDMVLLSIGVRPNSQLAKDAGLELNARGGIVVDEYMRTSDPDIYAVGDAVEVEDFNTGGRTMVPLAGPANKQGRIVAANLLGQQPEVYTGTQGTSVARIFDLTCAATGRNEKQLKRDGLEYRKDYLIAVVHPKSHAEYFPGALPMAIKLIFAPDGTVLGAQIVGYDGVDKRIDVLATALRFGATVDDLTKLELAYAPPYSSAKDPVNIGGYAACNQLEGKSDALLCRELPAAREEGVVVLDIQENEERMVNQIPDSIHIPLSELRKRVHELDPKKTYALYCKLGLRGYIAERVLKSAGLQARNILGGLTTYSAETRVLKNKERASGAPSVAAGASASASVSVETGSGRLELLDVCGLSCPGPIVQVNKKMAELADGDRLEVVSTDPGFTRDIESWCENTGNRLIEQSKGKGKFTAVLQKGSSACITAEARPDTVCTKEKTMIIFDGDLDKAIAAFIIATGAAAMGNQVNLFFTFWGLSIIRKNEKVHVKRDFMSKMFAAMLPRGSRKLKLSQMNMLGMGARMIRSVMKKKGVDSLESLIKQAQEAGVKITACQMSMDVMGLTQADLLDGVEIGGVASMLNDNDHSNMNLFI